MIECSGNVEIPRALHNRVAEHLTAWIGDDLIALVARFGIAGVFWQSGRTKVEGWLTVSDNAVALFADEYRVPLLPPDLAAHCAYAEHLFPILLVLGLLTRASALALLGHDRGHRDLRLSRWRGRPTWCGPRRCSTWPAAAPGAYSLDRALGLR